MKITLKIVLSLITAAVLFTACGSTTNDTANSGATTDDNQQNNPTVAGTKGVAQLGILKNAKVEIFEVTPYIGEKFKKLFIETTSGGGIESAGRFNTHSSELKDESFYIYQVSGGEDIDANDDGIEDTTATPNKGVLRAMVKGAWVKGWSDDAFRVTALSEVHYQQYLNKLNYAGTWIDFKVGDLISKDINNDGVVDTKDIMLFNPITNQDTLKEDFKEGYFSAIKDIHQAENGYALTMHEIALKQLLARRDTSFGIAPTRSGNVAFFADNDTFDGAGRALVSFDMSDLSEQVVLDVLREGMENIHDVRLSKDEKRAYVLSHGFHIVNIENPKDMKELSYVDVSVSPDAKLETSDMEISEDEKLVYLANGYNGIMIVDISDEENPKEIYHIDGIYSWNIALSKDGTRLYSGNNNDLQDVGVTIYDVSDRTNPKKLSFMETAYPSGMTLSTDESKLFVADSNTLKTYEIIDKKELSLLHTLDIPNAYQIFTFKDGKKLGVTGMYKGVSIVDISQINAQKILAFLDFDSAVNTTLSFDEKQLFVSGQYHQSKIIDLGMNIEAIK